MDTSRNDQLGELAADASLERSDFLVAASAQLTKFLEANREHIAGLGGLVLIDDEVDYLAIAEDLTFRSRSRYLDEATGKWVSENRDHRQPVRAHRALQPGRCLRRLRRSHKRPRPGWMKEPTATGELLKSADIAPSETVALGGENPYAAAADDWAARPGYEEAPEIRGGGRRASLRSRPGLPGAQPADRGPSPRAVRKAPPSQSHRRALGDLIIVDDDDERLTLRSNGSSWRRVVPEAEADAGTWRKLDGPGRPRGVLRSPPTSSATWPTPWPKRFPALRRALRCRGSGS